MMYNKFKFKLKYFVESEKTMFILYNGLIGNFTGTTHSILFLAFTVITIVSSYLLGSINSAIIISRGLYHDDVRKHGSGNPGLTNMLRTYGKGAAGLTLLGDVLKTVISIFISAIFFGFNYVGGISTGDGMCYIAGLFAVIGHISPIFYRFKGGKGVLTTAVTALVLSPIVFLILFALFAAIVAVSKYVSLGSVTTAILYPVMLHGYFTVIFGAGTTPGLAALASVIIAILIVWCHRGNLQRISDRTERKLSFKKKTAEQDDESEK